MQSDSFAFFHGYKVIYSISTTCNKWQYLRVVKTVKRIGQASLEVTNFYKVRHSKKAGKKFSNILRILP